LLSENLFGFLNLPEQAFFATKMKKKATGPFIKSLIVGLVVFASILFITFFVAGQINGSQKKREQEELQRELNHVKDRLRGILYANLSTGNALAVIYSEYGTPKNFDKIAAQLMQKNKFAEMLQLTQNGVITNNYPIKGYEKTIGINTRQDSTRKKEELRAEQKKQIFYAGPRPLRQGGVGILGKVPILVNNQLKGLCVVLTRLKTIQRALEIDTSFSSQFAYELLKKKLDHGTE